MAIGNLTNFYELFICKRNSYNKFYLMELLWAYRYQMACFPFLGELTFPFNDGTRTDLSGLPLCRSLLLILDQSQTMLLKWMLDPKEVKLGQIFVLPRLLWLRCWQSWTRLERQKHAVIKPLASRSRLPVFKCHFHYLLVAWPGAMTQPSVL